MSKSVVPQSKDDHKTQETSRKRGRDDEWKENEIIEDSATAITTASSPLPSLFTFSAEAMSKSDIASLPLSIRASAKLAQIRSSLPLRYNAICSSARWANNYFHHLAHTCCTEVDYGGCNCMATGCDCSYKYVKPIKGEIRYELKEPPTKHEFDKMREDDPKFEYNDYKEYVKNQWGLQGDEMDGNFFSPWGQNYSYCERCFQGLMIPDYYEDEILPEFLHEYRTEPDIHGDDSDTEEKAIKKYLWREGWKHYERVEVPPLAEQIVEFFSNNITTQHRCYDGSNFFAGRESQEYTGAPLTNVPKDELGIVIAYALARPECTLEVLDLNVMGLASFETVVEALSCNTSLKKIAVRWDEMSLEQAELFKTALRENVNLKLELIVGFPEGTFAGKYFKRDAVRVEGRSGVWVDSEIDLQEFRDTAKEGRGKGGIELKFVEFEGVNCNVLATGPLPS